MTSTRYFGNIAPGLLNGNAGVKYKNLTTDDQTKVRENVEEPTLHSFLFKIVAVSIACRELQNNFTKGSDHYPENRSQAFMFLDKYSKSNPPQMASEVLCLLRRARPGRRREGMIKTHWKKGEQRGDKQKDPYKDMECFKCGKKGHPTRFFPERDDNDSSLPSKSSKNHWKNN